MTETSRIEQLLLKDRLILSVAMVGIFLIAAIYTLFGVGMPMSAFEMTWGEMMPMNMSEGMDKSATMSSDSGMSGQGMGEMMMSPVWSLRYAVLVFFYVVGHDDRHDAAQCGIRCFIVFGINPSKSILIQSSSVSLDFPIGLSHSLGFLQSARNSITMAW